MTAINQTESTITIIFPVLSSCTCVVEYSDVYIIRCGASSTHVLSFPLNIIVNVRYSEGTTQTWLIFKFVGPDGVLCITSKCGLHCALRTPCEFETFTFSAPVFVKSMYSSSGFMACSLTSMKISARR